MSLRLSGLRILVVEDDPLIAIAMASSMEEAGAHIVGPYESLIDALENLNHSGPIDLAVLDIGLGEEESYPLADALKMTMIPFVFVTGLQRGDLPARFSKGRHLQKPFTGEALITKIAAMARLEGLIA